MNGQPTHLPVICSILNIPMNNYKKIAAISQRFFHDVLCLEQRERNGYKNEQKCDNEKVQTRNTDDVFSENISKQGTSAKQTDETEEHLSEGNKKEQSQPLEQKAYPQQEKYETECKAVAWYQLEGKERIQNLKAKMENENIRMFSISPEGVCCVREGNRFRRIGVLRAFPCQETKALIKCLSKDHIHAVKKGKYLWLSWERSVAR